MVFAEVYQNPTYTYVCRYAFTLPITEVLTT